jgi:hypothetical protein
MLLAEIIQQRGLNINNMKIIRHTVSREYIKALIASGNFELYQSVQKTEIFKDINYFISFTDMQGTKALVNGVYKVEGLEKITDFPKELSSIKELEKWGDGPYFKYDLKRDNSLSDLEGRLVIDWGKATISWHQKKLDKEIVEVLPVGYAKTFPGYQNVILSYDELFKIIKNPNSNRQWKVMLSNVYGIYLILDKTSGQQYVGSAYGKEGIWGRWGHYVDSKHGGNKILMELLNDDPVRYKNFQFSILNVLPNSSMNDEVIQLESIVKEKLGTRVYGLNAN